MDPNIEKRFAQTARSKTFQHIVQTNNLDTKAVLDIGCSYGEYLAHFGPGSVGVTLNETEVVYGKKKGLDVRLGNVESPDFALAEKFDVIFANNIFEHLYSPHQFLFTIKQFLKPGGVLVLGVPCIPKVVSLLRLRKFRGSLASGHINFFTRDTLANTVERAGWQLHTMRGFHFSNPSADALFGPFYPHQYATASPDPTFEYPEKRMRELAGYERGVIH